MSDDMRSSTTTSNKGRKPARPRILVVSNPSPYPELSSDSEEAKHAQNIPRPYRTLPHPPSPHPPPPPPTGRQPLSFSGIPPPPPLTADEQEPKQGYHSASSNPALSSPSSTSSPAVESTPPPSTPGQSAPPVDLSGEGTLRPEMFALSSADRNEAVCQRSAQIIDASKSSFSRRPHIRRTSQNSRPSSSPTTSTPDAYVPYSQLQPNNSSSDPYSAFQPGTSAPTSTNYMPQPYPKVASKPIGDVALLVTTNADNFTLVDVSGAMTGAYIRERIFSKLLVSDEAQPDYSIYRTEVSRFAIGDALTDEELFDLCRQQGDMTGTLKLLVSHSSAFVHEPPHEQSLDAFLEHTIPPPTLPQHGLNPRPRPPRSRSRHGSQSSASERVPPEDPGYEPSVSDDLNNGDRDIPIRRPPLPPAPLQKPSSQAYSPYRPKSPSWMSPPDAPLVGRGPESPTVPAIVPRSDYAAGASLTYSRHERYDTASRRSPSVPNNVEDTPVRHKAMPVSDATNMAESPLRHEERYRQHNEHTQKKSRPRTPQDVSSPPTYSVTRPYASPSRNPLSGGMGDNMSKRKNGRAIPMKIIDRGTYDSSNATSRPLPRVMKSNPNLRVAAATSKDHPPMLVPGHQPSRPSHQPPLPSNTSRPATSTGETSAHNDLERNRRVHDSRRVGMSPATPSGRTVTSPAYSNSPSSRTPVSPPTMEPFPRPHSAQDRRNSPSHASVVSPHEDRVPSRPTRFSPHVTTPPGGVIAREARNSPLDRHIPAVGPPVPPLSPAVPTHGPYSRDPVTKIGGHHQPSGDRPSGERTILPPEAEMWEKIVDDSKDGTVKPMKSVRSSHRSSHRSELTADSFSESDSDGDFFLPKKSFAAMTSPPANHNFSKTPPANLPAPADFPPPPSYPPQSSRRPHPLIDTGSTKDVRRSTFDDNVDNTWAPRPPPEAVLERIEDFFKDHDLDRPVIEMPSGGTSPTNTENSIPVPQRNKHKKSIRVVAAELKKRASRMESSVPAVLRKRNTKLWGSKVEEVTTEAEVPPLPSEASPGGAAKPIFRWIRGELIGKGTYGKVYLALNATTGEMIAVKQVEIPRTASDITDTRQTTVLEALKLESETLKDLDHPNIVQYLGFEETPSFLSIFLEYVPGGSIASCLRRYGKFEEEVTKSFTGQILAGLEYLHGKNILHRDLKADNILVEMNGICKISDFGISKRTDDIEQAGAYTSMQGTVFWMAPEVINAQKSGYNSKVDIWSVGCVVYEMWTGQRPWNGQEAMAVLLHLYQNRQSPPLPESITLSPLADDFRQKCFAMDPDLRPSAAELRQHPYLKLQPGWEFPGFQ